MPLSLQLPPEKKKHDDKGDDGGFQEDINLDYSADHICNSAKDVTQLVQLFVLFK